MKDYHNKANFSSVFMHSMSTIFSCLKSRTPLNQGNCTNQFCMHGRTSGFIHLQFGQKTTAWQVVCYSHFVSKRRGKRQSCTLIFCHFYWSDSHLSQWNTTAQKDFRLENTGIEFPPSSSQHLLVLLQLFLPSTKGLLLFFRRKHLQEISGPTNKYLFK